MAAAAWAWWTRIDRNFGAGILGHGRDVEQLAGESEVGLAGGTGEQAIMPNAVEAAWQDVEQEPADTCGCGAGSKASLSSGLMTARAVRVATLV